MNIRQLLVPSTIASKVTSGKENVALKGFCIHETANTSKGANADAHARLQYNGTVQASWHWTVDDQEAVQSFTHDYRCWHQEQQKGITNRLLLNMCKQ